MFRVRLSEAATVRMRVLDGAGRRVLARRMTRVAGEGRIVWRGSGADGRRVSDGDYRIRLVPEDRAGNRGRASVERVRVITAASHPVWATQALNPADGDRFGRWVRAKTRLAVAARVRWTVTRGDRIVRRLVRSQRRPGPLAISWDGRDAKGRYVSGGPYTSELVVASQAGTVRFRSPVWVGPYRISIDAGQARAGRMLRVTVRSTEPQARPPVIAVRGRIGTTRLRTRSVGGRTFATTLRLPGAARTRRLTVRVTGTDRGGQVERAERSWVLK